MHHDPDANEERQELPFEAYGQFGPGWLDLRVFNQDQVWVDIVGVPHALHEMTVEYRANLIAHLLEFAGQYRAAVARDDFTETLIAFLSRASAPVIPDKPSSPREWIESTPLMERLRAMTPRWEAHVTDDRDELTDEDTGRWRVTTDESDAYLADLDARTLTRTPGPGSDGNTDLRPAGDPVPLLGIGECRRARPAVFILDEGESGVTTSCATGLVVRITRDTARSRQRDRFTSDPDDYIVTRPKDQTDA